MNIGNLVHKLSRDFIKLYLLLLVAIFAVSCGSDEPRQNNTTGAGNSPGTTNSTGAVISVDTAINIDLNQRYQIIDGWETYLRMWEEDKINDRFDKSIETYSSLVADHLANNVGINRARLEIWSGLENSTDYWSSFYNGEIKYSEWKDFRYQKMNDNDDPDVANLDGFQFARFDYAVEQMLLPLKSAVEANGETLYINLCYVDFKWTEATLQGDISHANNQDEYAEFVSVFLNRLKNKFGISVDAIEIILEPENTESWRGRQIGNAIVKTADRLGAEGFFPKIIAPSTTRMNNAVPYLADIASVAGAIEKLDTFAYHRYGGESANAARSIKELSEQNGLKTAMLEKVGADIGVLFEDLTVANASAWTQYGMAAISDETDDASFSNGANYVVVDDDGSSGPDRVVNASMTTDLAQVFRFVRMGAQRVDSTTPDSSKDLLSFVNTDGSVVVVVRSRNGGGTLGIQGLPTGEYLAEFVAQGSSNVQLVGLLSLSEGESQFVVDMPESGLLTVYPSP